MSHAKRTKNLVADARVAIRSCIGTNIRQAERIITRFLETRLQETGLSVAEFSLMAQIAAAPDDTIGALAKRLGLDQSTLSRNLRALEKKMLVEIVVAEADLRRRAVWLTEAGARKLESTLPVWRKANAQLAETLSPDLARRLAEEAEALEG
jgi:DNA-binding MarR family transcriptional regulator